MAGYGGTNWDSMRVSDVDRERSADILKAALSEGRLDWDEHQQRLDEVMKAQTYGQLKRLTADLPVAPGDNVPAVRPGYPATPPQKEVLATVSLVLGIISYPTFGMTTIPAIITGHLALSRIKRSNAEGHGQAMAGLVLGYLPVAGVVIVGIVLAVLLEFI